MKRRGGGETLCSSYTIKLAQIATQTPTPSEMVSIFKRKHIKTRTSTVPFRFTSDTGHNRFWQVRHLTPWKASPATSYLHPASLASSLRRTSKFASPYINPWPSALQTLQTNLHCTSFPPSSVVEDFASDIILPALQQLPQKSSSLILMSGAPERKSSTVNLDEAESLVSSSSVVAKEVRGATTFTRWSHFLTPRCGSLYSPIKLLS